MSFQQNKRLQKERLRNAALFQWDLSLLCPLHTHFHPPTPHNTHLAIREPS